MANTKQAKKRVRQNETRRSENTSRMSALRTFVKKVRVAIAGKNHAEATTAYKAAQSNLDNNARKGLIHPNRAARLKSRLNAQIKALQA